MYLPISLKEQFNAALKPLCEHEVDRKMAIRIDIPPELIADSDLRVRLMDFERDAQLIGSLGNFNSEYWIKPDVVEEYIEDHNIRRL